MMNFSRLKLIRTLRVFCSQSSVNKENIVSKRKEKSTILDKPIESTIDVKKLPSRTKIDANTIALLERLSLVDCANKKGIETLEDAIAFADQILQVNTTGVEPLVTVLEDYPLAVRDDIVTEGNCREDILKNATLIEEDYFVAPPGNIPLEAREDLLYEKQAAQSKDNKNE